MKIWVDLTAPAHPIVLRPVIQRLQSAGHEVFVTARDYAQTVELSRRLGIEHQVLGRHGGASRVSKLKALLGRTVQMRRLGRRAAGHSGFDLAFGHGSNDLALAAASLRIPAVNMFDYEWAHIQHRIGCRLARVVMTPDTIPADRLLRYGAHSRKLAQFPGLKEEYYLADFVPDESVFKQLEVDRERVVVIVRPPPDVALYHMSNELFPKMLDSLGRSNEVHVVVIPRTESQKTAIRALQLPSVIIPGGAVDAQSLIALADLVISAGGTMNREAVALGTPVYTTFSGRLGGVDEALIREGRLRPLQSIDQLELIKCSHERVVTKRDPDVLVELALSAVG
jgi:uncharacterized protein